MLTVRQTAASLASRPFSMAVTILVSLAPLVGAILLDWDAFTIVVLYWFENVMVGIVTVLKMLVCDPDPAKIREWPPTLWGAPIATAEGSSPQNEPKELCIPLFIVHYGLFTLVHGYLVFTLFDSSEGARGLAEMLSTPAIGLTVLAMLLGHFVSFSYEFILRGGRHATVVQKLMLQPYGRVVVMHVAVLFGGLFVEDLGSPTWMLVVLVLAKTMLDLIGLASEQAAPPFNDESTDGGSP